MTKFYRIRAPRQSRYTGDVTPRRRWSLPGLRCAECNRTVSGGFTAYPSVDLSSFPKRGEYEERRVESFDEFVRLREQVRALVPPEKELLPGVAFGPLMGTATGSFSLFFFDSPWTKLVRRETLEQLQAEGIQGLHGFRTELRFRQKNHPELLELEVLSHGRLHQDSTPEMPPPCPKCGRASFSFPEDAILDQASLPAHTDLFRLSDFETIFIATERFVEAVRRLGLDEIDIREVSVR